MSVRPERTGWRDQEISERHRTWGFNCPAVDLDFLMVEYNAGRPAALVEYKYIKARQPDLNHATYRALTILADSAKLPFIIAFYERGDWWFRTQPVNALALQFCQNGQIMDEREFVSMLYRIRNVVIEQRILANLNTAKPTMR